MVINNNVLEVENLSTSFSVEDGTVQAVDNVDFSVQEGEVFGIVGESGSGKSVTALSILDLIKPPGKITNGEIRLRNKDLASKLEGRYPNAVDDEMVNLQELPQKTRSRIKGRNLSMVFQDPTRSFNKSITVGRQVAEAVEVNKRPILKNISGPKKYGYIDYVTDFITPNKSFTSEESFERAIELLEMVGISDPELRADEYPHQFSGGMLQRAMIAMALAGEPDLLIADEPTSALDVTIQSQILELLDSLRRETGLSVILISHNLGVIARMCNRIGVMYAGQIVERGTLTNVFEESVHPYTDGLIGAIPEVEGGSQRLKPIEGHVPDLINMTNRCYFVERCPKAMEECYNQPPEFEVNETHSAKCYLAGHEFDPKQKVEPERDQEQTRKLSNDD